MHNEKWMKAKSKNARYSNEKLEKMHVIWNLGKMHVIQIFFFFIVYCTFGVTSAYDFWWHEHLWLVASRSIHRVITQQALVSDIRLSYARCPPSLAHTNLWSIGLIRSGDLEMIGWLSETTGQKLSGSWQWGRGTKQITGGIKIFFFSFSFLSILGVFNITCYSHHA